MGYLVQLHLDVGYTTQSGSTGVCESSPSMLNQGEMKYMQHGKKAIKLHQKSIVYVLKYVTDGFRLLHPLLLSMQLFLLLPDNSKFDIVQHYPR